MKETLMEASTALEVREKEAFGDLEKAAGLPDGSVRLVGFELSDHTLTVEEWLAIGKKIATVDRWTSFALGDWLNHGYDLFGEDVVNQAIEATPGERYDVASRITGLRPETIANYASVARRVARERRRIELHFTTHEAVASLPADEQSEWLQKAVDNEWSRDELRDAIREAKQLASGEAPAEPAEPPLTIGERIERAARLIWAQAQQTPDGYFVPSEPMAQLASALGEE